MQIDDKNLKPLPDDPSDPNPKDFEGVSDKDLDRALAGLPPLQAVEADEQEEDTEEPEKETGDAKEVEEPEKEAETQEAKAGDENVAEEEEAEEDLPDYVKSILKEAENRAKHSEAITSRLAGQNQFVIDKLKALESKIAAKPSDGGWDEGSTAHESAPVIPAERSGSESYVMALALRDAAADFVNTNEEANKPEIVEAVKAYLANGNFDASELLASGDPLYVMKTYRSALQEAFYKVTADAEKVARQAARERSFDSGAQHKARKLKASGRLPGQAVASAGKGIKKPVDPAKLSDADFDAELDRLIASAS